MNEEVKKLISDATTGTDSGQRAFAEKIPIVLQAFNASQVRDQFIPFLKAWMPYNNRTALLGVAKFLADIARAAGGLKPVAPIVESLFASETAPIDKAVIESLEQFKGDSMLEELLSTLLPSRFDAVRRGVVKVVKFVANEGFMSRTYRALAADKAFCVRYAVAEAVKDMKVEHAQEVVQTLVRDQHSRIRGLLAHDLYGHDYYFKQVATVLARDMDWSVRSAVAVALGKAKGIQEAAPLCAQLIQDGVWQVQVCALRSLTQILTQNPTFQYTLPGPLVGLLDKPGNSQPLKLAVIGCFFAQRNLDQNSISEIMTRVLREQSEVKLEFLQVLAARRLVAGLENAICNIVRELREDDKWRIRLGVVSILGKLAEVIGKPEIAADFMNMALKMTNDKAFPVREAAIAHLAANYVKEGDNLPDIISRLKKKNSYRKRQAAIGILVEMRKLSQSEALKEKIQNELKFFEADQVNNVALVAKQALENQ